MWLDFFDVDLNSLSLSDPKIIFTVTNTFGISANMDLTFRGVSSDEMSEATIMPESQFIAQPAENAKVVQDITLDKNSVEGFLDFVNLPPATVYHSGVLTINPTQEVTLNEVNRNDYFSLGMRFEVPFECLADSFVYEEQSEVDWLDDSEDLFPRYVTVYAKHTIPFYYLTDFIFLDEFEQPTDTVSGTLLEPASCDEDGFSTDTVISNCEIPLTEEESENLKAATYIRMRSIIYTGDRPYAKDVVLQATDFADIQVGVKGVYKVDE